MGKGYLALCSCYWHFAHCFALGAFLMGEGGGGAVKCQEQNTNSKGPRAKYQVCFMSTPAPSGKADCG